MSPYCRLHLAPPAEWCVGARHCTPASEAGQPIAGVAAAHALRGAGVGDVAHVQQGAGVGGLRYPHPDQAWQSPGMCHEGRSHLTAVIHLYYVRNPVPSMHGSAVGGLHPWVWENNQGVREQPSRFTRFPIIRPLEHPAQSRTRLGAPTAAPISLSAASLPTFMLTMSTPIAHLLMALARVRPAGCAWLAPWLSCLHAGTPT